VKLIDKLLLEVNPPARVHLALIAPDPGGRDAGYVAHVHIIGPHGSEVITTWHPSIEAAECEVRRNHPGDYTVIVDDL